MRAWVLVIYLRRGGDKVNCSALGSDPNVEQPGYLVEIVCGATWCGQRFGVVAWRDAVKSATVLVVQV